MMTRQRPRHERTRTPALPRTDHLNRRSGEPVYAPTYDEARAIRRREAALDAALETTFPASDPIVWTR